MNAFNNLHRVRWILLLWTLLCFGAGCGGGKKELNLLIWSEYMDPELIATFEREFDCTVKVDYFEDPESMIAKLAAGGLSTYDIVVPSDTTIPAMIQRGMLAPLRSERIPNLKNIDPNFRNIPADPGNQYGAPVGWGTTGIYYRATNGIVPEASWSLIFDPGKSLGNFLLMEDARACIGAALRYKGFSANTTNENELAIARDLLVDAKKRSLGFEGGTGCKNRVLSRGAVLAMAYNGDAVRGIREDSETRFLIPMEGTQVYVDMLSIPAQAPHMELAETFINYCLDARVAARWANAFHFATVNHAAKPYIDMQDLANPVIYPPTEMTTKSEFLNDLGQANRLYDEIWTQIKAK